MAIRPGTKRLNVSDRICFFFPVRVESFVAAHGPLDWDIGICAALFNPEHWSISLIDLNQRGTIVDKLYLGKINYFAISLD